MKKSTPKPTSSSTVIKPGSPIPFLGLALRKHRGHVEVYMKLAPRRRWRLALRGPLARIPTTLPKA